jgi:hypothetical protein
MHLSLQEYFTACYLEPRLTASRFAKAQRTVPTDKHLHGWANQTEWLEVYVLLFELLARKDSSDTEDFFTFLFDGRFKPDDPTEQNIAARLLAELVVDPFVNLSASTRRRGRGMCWHAVFRDAFTAESGRRSISSISAIAQLMVSDSKGDLRKAWESAGLTVKDLRDAAIYLNLAGCTGIADIDPISMLTQLKVLSLSGCGKVDDLTPLSGLKKLTELHIDRCNGFADLGPLRHLKQLEILSLSGCGKLADLSALAPLKKLTSLTLPDCDTFDALQPIASMSKLRELSIDRLTAPVNFAYLLKCSSLQELFIDGSATSQDLSPLAQHPKLRSVHFHDFPPDIDLTPFAETDGAIQRICLGGTHPTAIPRSLEESGVLNPSAPSRRTSTKRSSTRRPAGK